jgi:NAD(P)-dependent dehydrogenase (short-subunit alcohol dehydrogenase family)
MNDTLRGPVIITGGTRGIGAATARLLASQGTQLILAFRSDTGTARQLKAELGHHVDIVQTDIADDASVEELFAVADRYGPLAGLVNSAGVLEHQARFGALDRDRWKRVFEVNVFGTAQCCREAVRRMSTTAGGDGGSIVNLSSRASVLGSPNEYVDYAASKAAVDTLTRGLALEVADQGIRVNAVRPGIIDTDLHIAGGDRDRASRLGPSQPMRRAGTADEVARAIVWLLSTQASFVTGTTLDVSGGR